MELGRVKKENRNMRTKCLRLCGVSMAAGGLFLVAGCVVQPDGRVAFEPIVVAPQPAVVYAAPPPPVYVAPPPAVVVGVPDSYVWDGDEYVGLVGDQYYYLGPGNVWIVAEPWRIDRFHGWERGHPDWRGHATRNDRYRADAHGHVQPRRDAGHDSRHDDHH